jgi:hypothetical protein
VTGPREAVLTQRIHGGTKARENNVEEAYASSGCSPCWENPEVREFSSRVARPRLIEEFL